MVDGEKNVYFYVLLKIANYLTLSAMLSCCSE
jgi:hypothetical protein